MFIRFPPRTMIANRTRRVGPPRFAIRRLRYTLVPCMHDKTPFSATDPGDEILAEEAAGARGWEGLADWTGGLPPDQVEALTTVRELEAVYPLLHALVG